MMEGESHKMSWHQLNSYCQNKCYICNNRVYKGTSIYWNDDGSHRVKHVACNITRNHFEREENSRVVLAHSDGTNAHNPSKSLDELSHDKAFQIRKQARENLRECYN